MSDATEAGNAPAIIPSVKIIPDIPVIYADGAMSQNWGPGVTKFFLGRLDGDPEAKKDSSTSVTVAQIIMPADGFVQMVTFFEHRLKGMIEAGVVSQELVDNARAHWATEKK